jgi:superfamily II DNA or RNA helicase
MTIQEVYAAIVDDRVRNELILTDLIQATTDGRSPLLLTGRTEHLKYFETELAGKVNNVFTLKGGMGKKQRRSIAEALAAVPLCEPRIILATGSYIGEGFDDARLDTLFLAMPISWKGTLQQYVGRLHRLHDTKRVGASLRLRRLQRPYAGANVRAPAERVQPDRLYDPERQQRNVVLSAG